MKAIWHGKTIADTQDALMIEGNYYFPPESVSKEFLHPGSMIYPCYWKGLARYYHLQYADDTDKNAAWTYRRPTWLSKKIMRRDFSNYIAFDSRVKIISYINDSKEETS